MFFHVPGHKGGYDPKGTVGTVTRVYTEANLAPTSSVVVLFAEPKRWKNHFAPHELEHVSADAES
jgi:hypothetical protein